MSEMLFPCIIYIIEHNISTDNIETIVKMDLPQFPTIVGLTADVLVRYLNALHIHEQLEEELNEIADIDEGNDEADIPPFPFELFCDIIQAIINVFHHVSAYALL